MATIELPAVADAGPIIHLDELGCVALLPKVWVRKVIWFRIDRNQGWAADIDRSGQ